MPSNGVSSAAGSGSYYSGNADALLFNRELFRRVDIGLLFTFFFFFIFAGNWAASRRVREVLTSLTETGSGLTAVLTSQFISNVPAALLLSEFTENWQGLLTGVNIGGLGTPIASPCQFDLSKALSQCARGPAKKISAVVYPGKSFWSGNTSSFCRAVGNALIIILHLKKLLMNNTSL